MRTWMVTIGVQAPDACDDAKVQEMVETALTKEGLQYEAVIVLGDMDEVKRRNAAITGTVTQE